MIGRQREQPLLSELNKALSGVRNGLAFDLRQRALISEWTSI